MAGRNTRRGSVGGWALSVGAWLAVLVGAPVLAAPDTARQSALERQADEVAQAISKIRGLRLLRQVRKGIKSRPELRSYVLAMLRKEMPDDRIEDMRRAYVKLGLVPDDLDLKHTIVELYAQQIAGFYDPEKKELFLIGEAPGSEQEMVMAHELVHALQDQHYDLLPMQRAIEDNDDRAMALTALVEGDATVAMLDYLFNKQMGMRMDVRNLPDLGKTMRFMNSLGQLLGASEDTLKKAPPVLVDNLLFGYVEGASFAHRLVKAGGYERVDQAFWDPPTSTEQILHPRKYLETPRDEPIAVTLPDLQPAFGQGWRRLIRNSFGEFNTRLLLASNLPARQASRAAEGWGGDRIEVFEGPAGERVVVWVWIGDTEQDAREFASAYRAHAEALGAGSDLYVRRHGKRVVVIDGAGERVRDRVRRALRSGVTLATGYPSRPGPELFANITVPEDWKREQRNEGERRITEWTTPDGAVTVRYVVEPAAAQARSVRPRQPNHGAARRVCSSSFSVFDSEQGRHSLVVWGADKKAVDRAVATIGAYNPRLGHYLIRRQRSATGASGRTGEGESAPAPRRYPRRVF